MEIQQLSANEYDETSGLSLNVFIGCGGKDSDEEGLETFKNFVYNKRLVNKLTFYGAFDGESLIDIIATKNEGKHISLFFIKPPYHGRGIGKQLFKTAILNWPIPEMTANSSPYAIPTHRRPGFELVYEEQVTHGTKYTSMKRVGTKVRELERVCQKDYNFTT